MNIPSIITLSVAFICAVIAFGLYKGISEFAKNAKTSVGTIIGAAGKKALVRFRYDKRVITAPAAVFDSTPCFNGKKVTIKFIPSNKIPDKWDVRIIGTEGYGQKKIKKLAMLVAGLSVLIFVLSAGLAIAL